MSKPLKNLVIPESSDKHNDTESDVSDYPESYTPVPKLTSFELSSLNNERKMIKNDLLLTARLSENRHKEALHSRAHKLKHHYREVEACDQVMAYGFVAIMFLLTGFYWFIMIFSLEIKETFISYHVIAPAFVYGSIMLGGLNLIL
ncbi:uncharacterized protein LOC111708723 [Eurytemora carolleeae]|uniref:uncharacterized protein LOC111708723 n=1 Tax=Eurytemora carolleeae TaxID=1294199 RepID=UPI000C756160|nr:uncharacterized protein LOC111708723 [Eurytemora carolleeae]|eukprot:XP_023337950.1 uncharacterized protein LOC111708723 [Eurytemora affinis]